ncbi:MAG: N-acetyltransferase, partial [Verrucomicrobiaceae bacterium]
MDLRSLPLPASERLSYERILRSHAVELEPILCDPRVYQFIDCDCLTPADLEESFIRKVAGAPPHRGDEQWLDYVVRLASSGVAIGRLEATILEGRAEVAYLFGPDFWGCGYATEGLAWLHEFIQTNFGIGDFWAMVKP